MWPGSWSTRQRLSAVFSCRPADASKKVDLRREEKTVRVETRCQSAKINRWIKPGADVSLLTVPLLCFHLLLQVSLHLTPPESFKKCWQTASRQHLYLHLIPRRRKKKEIPRNLMQNQSPALCLSPTFCSAVNASSLILAWLRLRKKSAALTLISFLFQYCCTFFISQCVHVLHVCL